jgi:hypothetical protein
MTLTAVVRFLVERDDTWDRLEIWPSTGWEADFSSLLAKPDSHRLTVHSHAEAAMSMLELPRSFSQFWSDRDAAARQRWRELELLSSLQHNERLVRFRPRGAVVGDTSRDWNFLRHFETLLERQTEVGWRATARELFAQLRQIHPDAVDAGCADVTLLFVGSQVAAGAYNVHCQGSVETLLMLDDPKMPHAVHRLIGLMLHDEIRRGDRKHLFPPRSSRENAVDGQLWQPQTQHQTVLTIDRPGSLQRRMSNWLGRACSATSKSYC